MVTRAVCRTLILLLVTLSVTHQIFGAELIPQSVEEENSEINSDTSSNATLSNQEWTEIVRNASQEKEEEERAHCQPDYDPYTSNREWTEIVRIASEEKEAEEAQQEFNNTEFPIFKPNHVDMTNQEESTTEPDTSTDQAPATINVYTRESDLFVAALLIITGCLSGKNIWDNYTQKEHTTSLLVSQCLNALCASITLTLGYQIITKPAYLD